MESIEGPGLAEFFRSLSGMFSYSILGNSLGGLVHKNITYLAQELELISNK